MKPNGDPEVIRVWEEGDISRDPVERLFLHMIANNLYDLARMGTLSGTDAKYKKMKQRQHRLAAHRWFSENNGAQGLTFRMACQAIGTDFDTLQRKILGLTANQLGILVKRISAFSREKA